jgi:hypothetical protein
MINEVYREYFIKMGKISSTKTKIKYSLDTKGSPRFLRIINERSLILVFCSPLLAKFMDPNPDPH